MSYSHTGTLLLLCTHHSAPWPLSAGAQYSPGTKQALANRVLNSLKLLTFPLNPPKVMHPTQIRLLSAPDTLMINCEEKSVLRRRGGLFFF